MAKIEFYEGSDLNYIDYLSLMKFEDGWKIVNKLFHRIPKEKKEYTHTVIEDYIQLTGNQVLDESNNTMIPFSKQGYTLHLPNSNPIATIIMLSGSAIDTTRNIDEFAIIKPALEKNIAVVFVCTGKVIEFLFTDKEINIVDELVGKALEKHKLSGKPKFLIGMSLGGTMALRYSEYALLNKSKIGFKPDSIAICDAPLDMVRMWHEPDIKWWVENRAKDYNTFNSIDLAGFYNYLRLAGNKQVELITSENKRKDYNNGSSPHSWTIVDNKKLIAWFLDKI